MRYTDQPFTLFISVQFSLTQIELSLRVQQYQAVKVGAKTRCAPIDYSRKQIPCALPFEASSLNYRASRLEYSCRVHGLSPPRKSHSVPSYSLSDIKVRRALYALLTRRSAIDGFFAPIFYLGQVLRLGTTYVSNILNFFLSMLCK